MFRPPRCPNGACKMHAQPEPDFFVRNGSYVSKVKAHRIPRFRCKTCRKGFSRQTFRHDYRDKKPYLNVAVYQSLCSGVGYRQSARHIDLTRRNFTNKARKIQRTVGALDANLLERAGAVEIERASPRPLDFQFDEFETYEMCRNTMPLSVPTAVESESRLILGTIAASIRPRGTMTKRRIARIERHRQRYGEREDRSSEACQDVLKRAASFRPNASVVRINSDFKTSYPGLIARVFTRSKVQHHKTLGRAPRNADSPLAAINLAEAVIRDLTGRVRRESWLTTKKCAYLNLHLGLFCCYRNWVRPRFNRDHECPGEIAGFAERRLRPGEVVGWRQDWGQRSPSPYGMGQRAVESEWARAAA